MIGRIRKRVIGGALLALISVAGLWSESSDYGAAGALKNTSPTLLEMLTFAIQDEHLARAEYELIMDEYGIARPFNNIMKAEDRHIEWMAELFESHGFTVPGNTAQDHVMLPGSLKAAYETGVRAEIDNIAMYDSFLERLLPDDVRDVFEQLKAASENHLQAFRNNLRSYEAARRNHG